MFLYGMLILSNRELFITCTRNIYYQKSDIGIHTLREINLQALYNVFYKLIFMVRLDVVSGPWEKKPYEDILY